MRVFKRWWIRGIPAPDGIGFEGNCDKRTDI